MNRVMYISFENDPHQNLAWEEALFNQVKEGESIFYLWQNAPVVVIGRHQNPFKEINIKLLEEKNIFLARRPTGGGAVYQDLGNLNFTFISHLSEDHRLDTFKEENNLFLLDFLSTMGFQNVYASGRNDLEIDGRKFSGSAFKKEKKKYLHHGTLLLDVNLKDLVESLTPTQIKMESKGIDSVRSRVVNLAEYKEGLTFLDFTRALENHYQGWHSIKLNAREPFFLEEEQPRILEKITLYKSDEWLYGKTPLFSTELETKLSWGLVNVHLVIEKGRIEDVVIYSDTLEPLLVDYLMVILQGQDFNPENIRKALQKAEKEKPLWQSEISEYRHFLLQKLNFLV